MAGVPLFVSGVLVGDVPVRAEDSLAQAWADIRHFRETDEHLSPRDAVAQGIDSSNRNIKYPVKPPKEPFVTSGYPDVTNLFNRKLRMINKETLRTLKTGGKAGVYYLFLKNFPNNAKWDLQVGHGLPGQSVMLNPLTGKATPSIKRSGKLLTEEQYATYKGKVVRAGYLSNYAFGQAVAAGELLDLEGITAAQTLALLSNLKHLIVDFDNPKDIKAIQDGYKDYRISNPIKLPTAGSFLNK